MVQGLLFWLVIIVILLFCLDTKK